MLSRIIEQISRTITQQEDPRPYIAELSSETKINNEMSELLTESEKLLQCIPQVQAIKAQDLADLNVQKGLLEGLNAEIDSKQNMLLSLEVEIQELNQAFRRETQASHYAQARLLSIENDIIDRRDEIKKAKALFAEKKAKHDKLESLVQVRSAVLAEKEKEQQELMGNLKTLSQKITQYNIKLADLAPQLELSEKIIAETKAELSMQLINEERLGVELLEKEKLSIDLDEELSTLAFSLMTVEQTVKEKTEAIKILGQQVNSLEESIIGPKKQCEELNQRLQDLTQVQTSRKEYRERLIFRIQELDQIVEMLNKEMTAKEENLIESKKEENAIKGRIEAAQVQAERLKNAIDFKVKTLKDRNQEIVELKGEYNQCLAEIEELNTLSEDLTEEITVNTALFNSKQERLNKALKRREGLEEKVEKKKNLIKERNSEVSN